jgi:hypothetical protein
MDDSAINGPTRYGLYILCLPIESTANEAEASTIDMNGSCDADADLDSVDESSQADLDSMDISSPDVQPEDVGTLHISPSDRSDNCKAALPTQLDTVDTSVSQAQDPLDHSLVGVAEAPSVTLRPCNQFAMHRQAAAPMFLNDNPVGTPGFICKSNSIKKRTLLIIVAGACLHSWQTLEDSA